MITADPKYPEIAVRLAGLDGNALAVIARVRVALRKAEVSEAEILQFTREANAGDYDNLLRTAMAWVEVS